METNEKKERWTIWILGGLLSIVVVLAVVYLYRPREIPPVPFDVSTLSVLGDRAKLRPHMGRLVAEIESGKILGSTIDSYRADFEKADEIRVNKETTTYYFLSIDPNAKNQEGPATLVIQVQNNFGHVFRCFAGMPDY